MAHGPDLDERVERNASDRAAIRASLEGHAKRAPCLRARLAHLDPGDGRPLSQVLQDALYDDRGVPR